MMKLKYPICCGLDVHKNVIVATIVITNRDGVSEYRQKSFSTINSDIQKFHNWLIENNCYHVCMESTGKYWIPIFNYLEKDIEVCLHIPNMSKPSKARKRTKRIQNGLPTSTNLTLSDVPLSLPRISASSGNLPDTALSWSAWNPLRRTASRTVWPFPMSALPACFLTLSAKQQPKSCLICWSIPLIPLTKRLSENW